MTLEVDGQTVRITDQTVLQNIWNAACANDWQLAYQHFLDALTDPTTGNPRSELPDALEPVYVWAEGGKKVNLDPLLNPDTPPGLFATYIRNYTARQYELRKGAVADDMAQRIQDASDGIAERFIAQLLYGSPNAEICELGACLSIIEILVALCVDI